MHYNIYRKQKKQESRDGGVTFTDVIPAEYRKGDFIMSATTCSERNVNQVERWVDDTLYISPDAGISWESTGIEREDSMQDAPEDVLRINNRQYYPVEVEYNEYFKVLLPEDLSGSSYVVLFIYDNRDRTGTPYGQLAVSTDNYQCINLTRSGFKWITTGSTATLPEEQFMERTLNFRCRQEGGMTAYLTLQVYDSPTNQTLLYKTNNVEILHNARSVSERTLSSPSQTRNLRTTPDYNSYYLWQKQVKAPIALNWSWKYPFEYSASTEVAVVNDPSCGYVEEDPVIYRWIDTEGIICDEVDDNPIYQWNEINSHLCVGGDAYAVEVYQVSYDGGLTWSNVYPSEYRKGRLIEADSDECNSTVDIYYRVSKSSLGEKFRVISELSGIQTAVMDYDYEVPINDGYIQTDWIPDGSTGFTLTFTIPSGYMPAELFKSVGFISTATLRKGVSFIGDQCFWGTTLSDLTVYGNSVYLGSDALPSSITSIQVPSDRVTYYQGSYHWSAFANKISAIL